MHTTKEALEKFEKTALHYIQELETFSLGQLQHKPSEDEWSLGQMYQHLINTSLYMQLRNMELCLSPGQEPSVASASKTEAGAAVFAQGGFPPVRIQVPPNPQYTPEQPANKEQLRQGLHTVIQRMRESEPALGQASQHYSVSHPRLGALTAVEWFLLVEMHFRHHLLQLDRLKQILATEDL